MPYESAPPLVLITSFICLAGVLQGAIYRTAYGKPKTVGQDAWDRAMARRDAKIALVRRLRQRLAQALFYLYSQHRCYATFLKLNAILSPRYNNGGRTRDSVIRFSELWRHFTPGGRATDVWSHSEAATLRVVSHKKVQARDSSDVCRVLGMEAKLPLLLLQLVLYSPHNVVTRSLALSPITES